MSRHQERHETHPKRGNVEEEMWMHHILLMHTEKEHKDLPIRPILMPDRASALSAD